MKIPDFVKALLVSRKFWLALLACIASGIMFARREINSEQFVTTIVTLASIVIITISVEDFAHKLKQ